MALTVTTLTLLFLVGVPILMRSDNAAILADNRVDHHFFATAEIERLTHSTDQRPLLAIVGASVTRSSFGRSKDVSASLSEALQEDYEVVNFSTGRQSLLEHLIFIERLPDDRDVTVALGLGPSRFTVGYERYENQVMSPRFGTGSDAFRTEAERMGIDPPRQTGWLIVDFYQFYIPRVLFVPKNIAKLLIGKSIRQDETEYVGRRKSEQAYRAHSDLVMSRFKNPGEDIQTNQELLVRIIKSVAERPNMNLVLIEHPIRPEFVENYLGRAAYAKHMASVSSLAQAHDVPYWTLGLEANLTEQDFFDWAHISSREAQSKLRENLVSKLEELSNER